MGTYNVDRPIIGGELEGGGVGGGCVRFFV